MTSTIITTVPATDAALLSAPIRNNFVAAANDINGIQTSLSLLGNMATQNQNNVTITGGAIAGSALNAGTVANAALANMAASTVKGSIAGGVPADLTATQLTTLVNTFTSGLKGAVPASGGGTTNFLRADGTFAAPAGGGGGVSSVATGTGLTGGTITSTGTISVATSTANTLAGYDNSGVFSGVSVGSGLSLVGGALTATGGGGGSGTALAITVAQTAHGFSVGNVIYDNAGTFAKAKADSGTTCDVVGIVTVVTNANNFTYTAAGRVTTLSGLSTGSIYFLSDATAGLLTTTEPTAQTSISKPLLIAMSASDGDVQIQRGILVGGGVAAGTVTSVAGVATNGFSWSISNSTTTPTITLSTSITGLLKGSGGALALAVSGTDVVVPGGALGTPSSGTLTNCSGLPAAIGLAGSLPLTNFNGGTGASISSYWRGDGTWFAPPGTGDVVGPASATNTGITIYDGTTGKLVKNTGILIDGSNNLSAAATIASGPITVTSSSATAMTVGRQGATNPSLAIDASVASCVTGISITSQVASQGVIISATSTAAAEVFRVTSKGDANMNINAGSGAQVNLTTGTTNRVSVSSYTTTIAMNGRTAGGQSAAEFQYTGAAATNLTASTEASAVVWNMAVTNQHATGTLTLQRDFRIQATTHTFVGASTLTTAATFAASSAPIAGTNATIGTSATFYSVGGAVGSGVTNSYGLLLSANSGATNNYIASFNGTGGEVLRLSTAGQVALLATNTTPGTTGNQTIDKPSGKVNIAAAGTNITVTNALCTTASIVIATVLTNDTTALLKNVVPGSGSFVITMNAAVTAETAIGFLIIN